MYGTASRRMATSRLKSRSLDQVLLVDIHALGRAEPREADRVRPDVVMLLQVQGMGHQPQHLELPIVQAEQGPDAHVVAAGLHRPGQGIEPPEIIALPRLPRMHLGIGLVMIGLLEDLVGADSRRPDRGISGVVHGGRVDVHAADLAVIDLDRIDRPHALGDELGAVGRVLAEDQDRPLVALPLQGLDLGPQVVRAERAADLVGIRAAKGAVQAVILATAAHVQRREQHDAVAVDVAFQLPGGLEDLLAAFLVVGRQQHGRFGQRQGLLGHALGDHGGKLFPRGPALEQIVELGLVDEVAGAFAEFDGFSYRGHASQSFLSGNRSRPST